jgi:hypothetical protein
MPADFTAVCAADQRVTSGEDEMTPPPRVVVDVPVAVRVDRAADVLREAVSTVGAGTLGTVLLGPADTPAIRIDSARARARRAVWGEDLFETRVVAGDGLTALDADPALAGYLGGWA